MKYLTPVLVIVIGGWLVRLENMFLHGSAQHLLSVCTLAFALFGFGISLQTRRNNKTWVKKLIVSFVFLFFLLLDLGYLNLPLVSGILYYLAADGIFYKLIYVLCGWLFFD